MHSEFVFFLKVLDLKNQIKMKYCGKNKNKLSLSDLTTVCSLLNKLYCLVQIHFFFPFLLQFPEYSSASSCSDLEYQLSKFLFYCYFGQSHPLEKNSRALTACWFYSAVIKGQTAQKGAYHWIPCHVFQGYKMIPALMFSPTLRQIEKKREKRTAFFF